jgi:hypothetical protein
MLVAADRSGGYDEDDLEFAKHLARRAAAAVDNARLYRAAERRAQAAQALAFVADGVARNRPYGVRGISSGRMPHFNDTLEDDQIELIVQYEREL